MLLNFGVHGGCVWAVKLYRVTDTSELIYFGTKTLTTEGMMLKVTRHFGARTLRYQNTSVQMDGPELSGPVPMCLEIVPKCLQTIRYRQRYTRIQKGKLA